MTLLKYRVRLILLFAATAAFAGNPKVATDPAVVVSVDGNGTLPGTLWLDAQSWVIRIFKKINVLIRWESGKLPTSVLPHRLLIGVHVAIKEPGSIVAQRPVCPTRAAFACSFPFDPAPHTVIVMYERVLFYQHRPRLVPRLLGHAIAHEIAHVLSGRTTHSETGIMKKDWTSADLDRMEVDGLEFTEGDIRSIQEGFDSRRRGAEPKQ